MGKLICVDTGRERGRISNAVFGVFLLIFCFVQCNKMNCMI